VVTAFLLVAANLVILLASGAEPNPLEGYRTSAWLQWRGRFSIIVPWWAFLVLAAGWVMVLRLVWNPESTHLRMVGPLRLMASPAIVAVLALVSAGSALTWAHWYHVDGQALYLIPVVSLVIIAVVSSYRHHTTRRHPSRGKRSRKTTPAARLRKDAA